MLAAKARVSDRRAIDIIQALERDGAIVYARGGGRGRRSLYGILLGLSEEQKERVKSFHRNYFTENKTVKLPTKGDLSSPKAHGKGEIQRTERVKYSALSGGDLPLQDAESPGPIRHEDPSESVRAIEPVPVPAPGDAHTNEQSEGRFPPALYERLAQIAGINLDLATPKKRAELDGAAQALHRARATIAQIDRFEAWWRTPDNWRCRLATEQGRKLGYPRLDWILEEWEAAQATRKTATVNGRSPPAYTPPAGPRGTPQEMAEAAAKLNPFGRSKNST